MEGFTLKFFVQENFQLHNRLGFEWLLEKAKASGIRGGSALRTIAGYGRHGRLHEDHFFELGGELPVVVEFVVTPDEADRLLALLAAEKVSLFYVKMPVEFGVTGEKPA
jgi:PII-like signaling protein